jgi:Cytochrome P460
MGDQSPKEGPPQAGDNASPIYGITIPVGYRDWQMIAVAQIVTDKIDQFRAQLGNEIAIKAYKEGKIPFPDSTIIAALHWNRSPSEGNNRVRVRAFPGAQSFVVGSAVNVQFMVKDSKKYAATGGWGVTLRTENRAMRHCTKPASAATNLPKITTLSSLTMHLRPRPKLAASVRMRFLTSVKNHGDVSPSMGTGEAI